MHRSASKYIMLAAFVARLSALCAGQQQQPMQAVATHKTTVIAGAGVIGLSSAYHLALENRQKGLDSPIVVIDALNTTFAAASSTNSGCLIPSELDDRLKELGDYSYGIYLEHALDKDFLKETGLRQQSLFNIFQGSGKGQTALPNWVKTERDWNAVLEPPTGASASLNPKALGQWLECRCRQLGVEIRTSTKLQSVQLSSDSFLESVTVQRNRNTPDMIPAQHLILAAGPWTASLLATILPLSPIDLGFSPLAGDFLVFENPRALTNTSLSAVFLDSIVGHKLEFVGWNDKTIWVCAQSNPSATLPDPGSFHQPDPSMVSELMAYANRFIDPAHDCHGQKNPLELHVVNKGRAFRPSTKSGLPIIAAVPRTKLAHDRRSDASDDKPSGIFVCSGHGPHGIVLGMGTGKIMSDLVLGQEPEVDISQFGLNFKAHSEHRFHP